MFYLWPRPKLITIDMAKVDLKSSFAIKPIEK